MKSTPKTNPQSLGFPYPASSHNPSIDSASNLSTLTMRDTYRYTLVNQPSNEHHKEQKQRTHTAIEGKNTLNERILIKREIINKLLQVDILDSIKQSLLDNIIPNYATATPSENQTQKKLQDFKSDYNVYDFIISASIYYDRFELLLETLRQNNYIYTASSIQDIIIKRFPHLVSRSTDKIPDVAKQSAQSAGEIEIYKYRKDYLNNNGIDKEIKRLCIDKLTIEQARNIHEQLFEYTYFVSPESLLHKIIKTGAMLPFVEKLQQNSSAEKKLAEKIKELINQDINKKLQLSLQREPNLSKEYLLEKDRVTSIISLCQKGLKKDNLEKIIHHLKFFDALDKISDINTCISYLIHEHIIKEDKMSQFIDTLRRVGNTYLAAEIETFLSEH